MYKGSEVTFENGAGVDGTIYVSKDGSKVVDCNIGSFNLNANGSNMILSVDDDRELQFAGQIALGGDVSVASTIVITADAEINLNGHNITGSDCRALWIKTGTVNITGSGTISSSKGTSLAGGSSVIRVGSGASTTDTASLTVGKDVTVSTNACYGITIFGYNANGTD